MNYQPFPAPLYSHLDIELRHKIGRLQVGKSFKINCESETFARASQAAKALANRRGFSLRCEPLVDNWMRCTHEGAIQRLHKYPMDELKTAGDAKEFDIDPSLEASLRARAATHAKSLGLTSNVEREGVGKYLVRLVATKSKNGTAAKRGPGRPKKDPANHKYPFARMIIGSVESIWCEPTDHHKVRMAASAYAKRMGWKLSCKLDGEWMRVTRTA